MIIFLSLLDMKSIKGWSKLGYSLIIPVVVSQASNPAFAGKQASNPAFAGKQASNPAFVGKQASNLAFVGSQEQQLSIWQ